MDVFHMELPSQLPCMQMSLLKQGTFLTKLAETGCSVLMAHISVLSDLMTSICLLLDQSWQQTPSRKKVI